MPGRAASFSRRHLFAVVVLVAALGGGSAVAASYINGAQIKPHSLPENRLTGDAIDALSQLGASVYSDDAAVTPPTDGKQTVVKQVQITTKAPGKLLVLDSSLETASVNNTTAAPLHYSVGIYVDGTPVPGTYAQGFMVPAETSGSYGPYGPFYGSLGNVDAGKHMVTITVRTTDTGVNYVTGGSGRLLVVATG